MAITNSHAASTFGPFELAGNDTCQHQKRIRIQITGQKTAGVVFVDHRVVGPLFTEKNWQFRITQKRVRRRAHNKVIRLGMAKRARNN